MSSNFGHGSRKRFARRNFNIFLSSISFTFFFFFLFVVYNDRFFLFLLVSQGWHYNDAFSRNFNGGVIYRRETRINHDGRAKSSRKIYSCDKRSKFNALRKISLWEDISLYEDIERMYEVSNATKL